MSRHLSITTAIAAVFLAAPLVAQTASQDTTGRSAPTAVAPERLAGSHVFADRISLFVPVPANPLLAVRAPSAPVAVARTAFSSEGGHNPAMMIVGGAAIVVGAVIGGKSGTTIMVGGGILGLAGLWNYLK